MNCSPPGSSVHGISQAKILEWVAISYLRGFFPTQGPNHWATSKAQKNHKGIFNETENRKKKILSPLFGLLAVYCEKLRRTVELKRRAMDFSFMKKKTFTIAELSCDDKRLSYQAEIFSTNTLNLYLWCENVSTIHENDCFPGITSMGILKMDVSKQLIIVWSVLKLLREIIFKKLSFKSLEPCLTTSKTFQKNIRFLINFLKWW